MSRRSPGEGSITQRKNGRWQGSLQVGGTRLAVYGRTRSEVAEKLRKLKRGADTSGRLPTQPKQTVAEFLDSWLGQAASHLRPTTLADYTVMANKHILPTLGSTRLSRLTPLQLAKYQAALGKTLSPRRVRMVHDFLHKLLGDAAKWGLVATNAADLVDAPGREASQPPLWTQEETAEFLRAAIEGTNAYDYLLGFLVATGCRIGEALGLQWTDIDWQRATVRIERQITELHSKPLLLPPKTKAGMRTISIPGWAMELLRRQKAQVATWRLKAGGGWPADDRVFPTAVGTVPLRGNVRRALHESCTRLDLPRIRTHDLRHISLSLLAMAGVPVKVAQQRAGHSSAAVTINVYQHVLGDGDKLAAEALDKVMGGVPL